MSANNAAGIVGKFGAANYTSLSRAHGSTNEAGKLPPRPPSKFFKSRNPAPVCEETIEEEDEADEEEDEWTSMDKENISKNVSKNQSVDGSLEQTVLPRGTSTHLRVGVRLRPLSDTAEVAGGVSVDGDQVIVKGRVFPVSCVLGEDTTQEEVYNKMVRPQVTQLGEDEACNSILFAYGPTGTGKTYTMGTGLMGTMETMGAGASIGRIDSRGILPRALKQLFDEGMGDVAISYYEILKDETCTKPKVVDLLIPGGKVLSVKLDKSQTAIQGLSRTVVRNENEALATVASGSQFRSTESTMRNQKSSRSHAILVLYLTKAGIERKLSLVDLAGSEAVAKASGSRAAEGVGINESLLHLGNVIRALAERKPFIPYRDTPLTWVLRDSLTETCLISMIFCVSPSAQDICETLHTLKFAEQAKRIKVRPVAAHLLAKPAPFSFRTPRTLAKTPNSNTNNTIHSGTPSRKTLARRPPGVPLNRTIGTPGKRAREELPFMTPLVGGKKPRTSNLTSTVQPQKRSEQQRVLDVSTLGISVIEPPEETVNVPKTFSEADVTTMMESMGSIMTERLGSMMGNMGEKLSSMMSEQVERQMEKMAEMMASKVTTSTRAPTRSSARTPARRTSSAVTPARTSTRTPGRRAASRATSSPKSLEVVGGAYNNLASRRETDCSPMEMHEDNSLTERPTTIEVLHQLQEEEEEEDIISGNTLNSLTPRHRRLQQVAAASPDLSRNSPGVPLIPIYSSPASSSLKPPASEIPIASPSVNPLSSSPSVEEMERMLGINADSPGAQDFFDTTTASSSTALKKPAVKKSIRRTTMLTSEIFDGVTLADIRKDQQSLAMGNPNRRRSSRVERIYYGSPSNLGKSRDQEETSGPQFKHPLMVKENWKVLAGRQKTHNNNILTLLNTANTAMLTKLPAVGPKSAYVLQQYRDLHDGIKSIGELKDIPGLSRNFFDKFCTQNQVKEVLEEEGEVQ